MRIPFKHFIVIFVLIVIFIIIYFYVPSNTPESANFKILVTVLNTVSSIFVGISLHKYKVNEEIVKAHFDTIRQLVIEPLIDIIRNDISKLPDIEDIQNIKKIDYGILNLILCKDFIENHYPEIKEIWQNVKRTSERIEESRLNIEHIIKEEIDRIVSSANSPYPLQSVNMLLNMQDMDRFKRRLLTDLLSNRYTSELFQINYSLSQLHYQELPETEFNEDGLRNPILGITLANAKDRTTFLPIQIRMHFINRIKEIEEGSLKDYRNNFSQLDMEILQFQIELNKIKYSSKLNFYGNRCSYV